MLFTVLYTLSVPKIYEASSVVLLDEQNPAYDFMQFSYGNVSRSSINNNLEILQSRPVLSLALQYIQNHPEQMSFAALKPSTRFNVDDPVYNIRKGLKTSAKKDTDIIRISFQSLDPLEAMVVSNSIADALIQQNTIFARLEFTNAREFLETQLNAVTQRLRTSEEELRDYKVYTGIYQLSAETEHLIERAAIANANLLSASAEYAITKDNLDFLQKELSLQDSLLLDANLAVSTPFIEQLKSEVVRTMSRITTLVNNNDYSEDHPEIMRLNRTLDNATKSLDEEIRKTLSIRAGSIDVFGYRNELIQQISTAQINENLAFARVNSYQTIVDNFENRLSMLPYTEMELARLQRNYRIDEHIFSLLAENLEDARVAEQARIGNIRIIDRAILPHSPVKPNKRINLMVGFMLSIIISTTSAVALHIFDTKIRTLDDVEKYVKPKVLGTIPMMSSLETQDNLETSQQKKSPCLITHYNPKSPNAEAYRTLRTNVMAVKSLTPLSLIITSSCPSEGKSTTLANLAVALVQMNLKVILVDFDMRKPVIHNMFNIKRDNGSSDFLSNTDINLDSIIKNSGISNLDIITSGLIPPNPSELIASNRTDELIKILKERYDYILFDIPPVIVVTDAIIMAKKTDMLLMLIMVNQTDRYTIKRTQSIFENINIPIEGIIVNGIHFDKYFKGYDYYKYFYNYYYEPKTNFKSKIIRKLSNR